MDDPDDDAAALAHEIELECQLLTEYRWTDDDTTDDEEYFNAISEGSP